MTLPKHVIDRDHSLESAYTDANNELMEHRWFWTLAESNPKRVSIRQYARDVGRAESGIRADVNGWAAFVAHSGVRGPGKAQNPDDFRQLAKLGVEKQAAAEAIARTSGRSVNATARDRDAIKHVVSRARERATDRGTTVEHEIEEAARIREQARQTEAKNQAEHRRRHTAATLKIESEIGAAIQRLNRAYNQAEDMEFSADELELLTDALGKLKALLHLVELRIVGSADGIDWDGDLAKLTT